MEGDYKYLIQYPGGKRELYLPDSDVGETQNLVTSLKDVAIAMDAQLISTLQSYDAPLPIANSRRVPAIPNANVFLNDDGEMIVTDTPGVSLSAGVERVTSSASMFERFGAAGSGKALQLSYPSSYSFRIPPQLGSGIGMALDFRIDENSSGFKLLLSGSSFGSLSSIFIHPSSMTLPEELVSLPVVANLDYRVVLTFRPFGSGETLGFLQLIRISGNDSVSVAHSERFSLSELSGDYGAFFIYAESNTDSADIYSISAWMLPLIFEDFQDEDTNSAPSRWDIEKVEGLSAEILSGASSYYSPDNHSKSLKLSFLDGYSNGSCVYSVTPEDYSQIEVEVLLGSLDGAISMHITEDLSLVFDSEGAVAGVGTYLNFHDSNLYLGALPSNVTWLRVVLDFVSQTASLYYQASASPIVTNFSSLNIAPPYVTQLSLDAAVDTVGALSINNIYGFVMDQDGDMLADSIEEILNLDSSKTDTDSDLLSDLWELDFGTSGNNPDVDLDGLPDGWELMTNSNPYFPDASESKLLGYLSGRRDGLVGAPSWGGLLQFEALNLKSRFFSNALLYYDIYLDHSEDLLNWEEAVVPLAIEFSVDSNYTDFDHVFESNHGSRFYRLRAKQKP